MPRLMARTFRALVWTVAVALFLEAAVIKAPMALTRLRMQHLLADFHSIYPNQSTWSDAQRIIAHWQNWGYSRGSCTQTDCDYEIVVSDPVWRWLEKLPEGIRGDSFYRVFRFVAGFGWRPADLSLRLVVQDGKIVRTRTVLNVASDQVGLFILVSQVRSRLRRAESEEIRQSNEPWILGRDEQLDDHPDYKVGRPGGCEICERADVTYTPTLQHSELIRLTRYNLSCLTGFRSCTQIYDLLPAARDWHLYDGDYMGPKPSGGPSPIPCHAQPRALGRDAEVILEVDPLRIEQKVDTTTYSDEVVKYEVAQVKLIRILKGKLHGAGTEPILIEPYFGSEQETPPQLPEHLVPGHRVFVLLNESNGYEPDGRFLARRCGVLDDTPAHLATLEAGMAQDVSVRHPIQ